MRDYLAIKKKEIMLFPGKWLDLETIMLKEISQTQKKSELTWFLSYEESRKNKNILKREMTWT